MKLYYDEIDSPIGPLLLIADEDDVAVRIDFGSRADVDEKVTKWGNRYFNEPVFIHDPDKVKVIKTELQRYFAKERQSFTFLSLIHISEPTRRRD